MNFKILLTTFVFLSCFLHGSISGPTDRGVTLETKWNNTIHCTVAGTNIGKRTVQELLDSPKIGLSNAPEGAKIISFQLSYPSGKGGFKTLKSSSELFSKKMLGQISSLRPGSTIYFEKVQVMTPSGILREAKGATIEIARAEKKKR